MKDWRMNIAPGLLVLAVLGLGAGPVQAQSGSSDLEALKQDLESVKKDLAEIKKTLGEMRQLLIQRPAAPAPPAIVKVSAGKSPSMGQPDAPVTVIEFTDYQCPFCQRHSASTLPDIKKDYIDTGKVRYVLRDFPLDSIHPQARKAAEAAHCAGEQGKYWEMHDLLFKNRSALMVENLKGFARDLGLNTDTFNACLDEGKYAQAVSEHLAAGSGAGVSGTPTFFIGKPGADGTFEAAPMRGAQPIAAFRQAIDKLLDGKKDVKTP